MKFETFYRISFYVMLFLGTLALNIDAADDFPLAPLYPIAVALGAVAAMATVDRDPRKGLPRDLANLLALASVLPSFLEFWSDSNLLVLALGHWLVLLQLIKMFLPKTIEDDWFLYLLSLTQVVVGAFLPGERIGMVIVLWALASLWTLGLNYLRRESQRPVAGGSKGVTVRPEPEADDPYPGLINLSFVLSAAKVALLTLALGGFIFLLMPRWDSQNRARRNLGNSGAHLTGFSDTVQLGQMGEILESDEIVMNAELYDDSENRIRPRGETLWRGVTMELYDEGRWYRRAADAVSLSGDDAGPPSSKRYIRQRIRLEASDTEVLFSIRPVLSAEGRDLLLNAHDGTIYRGDLRPKARFLQPYNRNPGPFVYTVYSSVSSDATQQDEVMPGPKTIREGLLEVPENLVEILRERAEPVVASIPEDDLAGRAEALDQYLRSGEFAYTLNMAMVDQTVDPIADFLVNRKQGHCEYFASALTMLLRSVGIPARVVNGFKGGDWNELGQVLVVRQKHAHSWVEALVGREEGSPRDRPVWLTLDPTPAIEREEVIARVGGTRFRSVGDFLRYVWVFYVVGFDAERQNRVIYQPIRNLFEQARRGFLDMRTTVRAVLRWLLNFPNVASMFSARGFFVTFLALGMLTGAWLTGRRVFRWIRRMVGSRRTEVDLSVQSLLFYRRLVRILEKQGLRRPRAETQREYARRAGEQLAARGSGVDDLARVPERTVDAFYHIRFGGRKVDSEEMAEIEAGLERLEASLSGPRQGRSGSG